jgi:hypothetical protein
VSRTLVAAVVLAAAACGAAHATLLQYEWTIDWQNRPDQTGLLGFDDEGDASARSFEWFQYFGLAPPPTLQGLPTGFGINGRLTFDGSAVTALYGCDDFFEFCNDGYATPAGWTRASFALGATGTATRWTPDSSADPDNCGGSAVSVLSPSCFRVEQGLTTFSAVDPATPVPEPATWALMAGGLLGMALLARRRIGPAAADGSAFAR